MVNLDLAEDHSGPISGDATPEPNLVTAHRFPKPKFPASVATVPLFLLVVSLLAAGALALLRSPAVPEIPGSAPAELGAAAGQAAAAVAGPVDQLIGSSAPEYGKLATAKKGRASLRRIAHANDGVEGLALVTRATGAVVADRGDEVAVPPTLPTPADGPRTTMTDDRLIVSMPVSADRVLVGSLALRAPKLPGARPDQRVLLVGPDGAIVAQSSATPDTPAPVVQSVAGSVSRGQPGFAADTSRLVPDTGTGVLAIPGTARPTVDTVTAAGGAAVTGAAGTSGLQTVVVRSVPLVPGATTKPGWTAAGIVAAGGVVGFVLLRLLLVRPVRRLRDDVDRLVTATDEGREADGWIRRSWLRQTDRVARYAARLPLTASGTRDLAPSPAYRFTIGGVLLLVIVGSVLTAALAGGFVAVHNHQAARTDVLVERSREMVEDTAEDLERTLTEGLAAVQSSASPVVGENDSDWDAKVSALRVSRPVFRSVYVRGADGNIVAAAGEQPRAGGTPTAPLEQLNQSGPEPIVTAWAPTHDGRFNVIAEFDPHALNADLRRADRPTTVVDGQVKTVLGSDGYVAFSAVDDPVLHRSAVDASVAPAANVGNVDGNEELVSNRRIGQSEATARLGWVVQQDREVTTARYTVDPVGRATTVIVGLGGLAVVGLLAWGYVTTVGPLERLAGWLGSVAEHRPAGPCPPPRRLDEVGAVMAGLNHCMRRE